MTVLDVAAEHVMTLNPAFVNVDASLQDAAGMMVQGGFRHLPVVDPDRRVVGILSERELRARLGHEVERFPEAARELLEERVEAVMRLDPITVGAKSTLRDIGEILEHERIGAVPVVDDQERLIGILSYVDVLRFLREADRAWRAVRPVRSATVRRSAQRPKPVRR